MFHRINILTPSHAYAGYGHGHSAVEYVDVLDFGRGPANPPSPRYGAGETPSPLPPGASYPIGHPITLQPIAGRALTVNEA